MYLSQYFAILFGDIYGTEIAHFIFKCSYTFWPTVYLVRERSLYFPQEVVNLLASILIYGGAHRPYETEDEPELHHTAKVFRVRWVHLTSQRELGPVLLTACASAKGILSLK